MNRSRLLHLAAPAVAEVLAFARLAHLPPAVTDQVVAELVRAMAAELEAHLGATLPPAAPNPPSNHPAP